jgi:translation initiation factor IF-3
MNFAKNQTRVNHRIRATEVRVIGDDGSQVGVMPVSNALKLASEKGLDLVEIAPEAKPPVCRIVDFGKFRYEQAKKHRGDTKHSAATKLKELKFHVNIGASDREIKLRHATDFLQKGMRVKLSLFFRGREMFRPEFGKELMRKLIEEMAPHGHSDVEPRLIGKNMHVILVPGRAKPKVSNEVAQSGNSHSPSSNSTSDNSKNLANTIKIDLKPASSNSK